MSLFLFPFTEFNLNVVVYLLRQTHFSARGESREEERRGIPLVRCDKISIETSFVCSE